MRWAVAFVAVALCWIASAQYTGNGGQGTSLPQSCSIGSQYVVTTGPSLHICSATNTWSEVGGSSGGIPAGSILMVDSGSCPTGFGEVAGLASRFPMGTVAANGDVGGTGGANTFTPAGTVAAPIFTGTPFSSVINHTHSVSVNDPGHTHTQASQTATTGGASSWEHGAIDTSSTAAETLPTGSNTTGITATTANPAGGVASITPAGTNSAPAFTGTQADQRPAWLKVIFCKKA